MGSSFVLGDYYEAGESCQYHKSPNNYPNNFWNIFAPLVSKQAPEVTESAIVGLWRQSQDVAHHGVNVNIVHHALLVSLTKSRPMSSQEWMHAWESVVIAMVTYWKNTRSKASQFVGTLSIPLLASHQKAYILTRD